MPFITFGSDTDSERNIAAGGAALVAGLLAAGAIALGRSGSTTGWSQFSDEWPEREPTRQLPTETMEEVVEYRRR